MIVKSTKDYSIFKRLLCNRELNLSHVDNLVRSIQEENRLEFDPILCNKDLEVIDGQHRLEAAKRLRVSIHYTVNEKLTTEDIIRLNSVKERWRGEDYLHYYITLRNPGAMQIKRIMDTYNLSYSSALIFYSKMSIKQMKMGQIELIDEDKLAKKMSAINEIQNLIKLRRGSTRFGKAKAFLRALNTLVSHPEFQLNVALNKLEYRMGVLRTATSHHDYCELLEEIYNYKNRNQISLTRGTFASFSVIDD